MRIKKIELIGFKSFKDRTVIHFDAGITGIVGPNGCGKSNIVDALVWVMGEMSAKDLRGSTMTDVIFGGAEGYAPLGMCEVSLTLENDGGPFPAKYIKFSEIMVTRRLHRNGEGEYFVNKEPARLKDVQEIFMDTGAGSKGFSIIQQGMIGKIITAKPEDRRHLIEEAAGITKFKARKKESQRKLVATDQNLVRLQDIIGELKRQIDSLQRQAQRAERYRNLKQQIEDLDLWLASVQFSELRAVADQAQKIFIECQDLELSSESEVGDLQSKFEALKLSVLEKEKSVEELQSSFFNQQSAAQKQEMQIQELRFEIEQARRNEQMTGSLLQEQKARLILLEKDQVELTERSQDLKVETEDLQLRFNEKNEVFQKNQSRINGSDKELTTTRQELFAVSQVQFSVEAKVNSLTAQIQDHEERQQSQQMVLEELREKKFEFESRRTKIFNDLEKERQMQLDLSSDVESFQANKKILQEQVVVKKQEVETFKDNLNQVASRLYGLENLHSNFEGFEEGVKNIMLWQKAKVQQMHADGSVSTSFQPVSEIIEVPAEYEVAMEAALGSRLQMLMVPDSESSLQAVDHLKDQKKGRSSFISESWLSKVASSGSATPTGVGVKALLKDVIQSSEKHQSTVNSLLKDIVVVDSLRDALALRPENPGWTFVTVDGDVLSADGVLTGGASESAESGVLKRRREIKELSDKKSEWAGKLALAQAALTKIESQLANVVNDFEGAQKRKMDQEIKVTELRKDLQRAETEVANAEQAVSRQDREVLKLEENLQTLQDKLSELNLSLFESKDKKQNLEQACEKLQTELSQIREGFDGLQAEVTDLQISLATKNQEYQGVQRQLEMVTKSVTDLQAQLSRMSDEAEGYSSQMSENQYLLEEKKLAFEKAVREVEDIKARLAVVKDQYEQDSALVQEQALLLQSTQKARNDRQSKMNESQLKLEQARMKEQYLIDQIRERYMLNLDDVVVKYTDRQGDLREAEVQLKDLRDKIAKIGEVNLSAIEEYEQNSKRYEFLQKQHDDLTEAKENLRKVIDRINRICTKRFKETFDLVNDRFTRVFPVLFGGGEARLELHEDPEKNEMGIEIVAKPPGKKMQNVTLMSGGEKALTAVALVFSIFLVKPSPYCLLDEVDAPLDDANVYRFNDLVREMAKRSQIIVVTHNKHTMEVAAKLYGVTMQERGVSTMVSVSL
ncbi:MAG: chromosome segregation protein SMC [Pseudobdellovibrionaceae bacterium]